LETKKCSAFSFYPNSATEAFADNHNHTKARTTIICNMLTAILPVRFALDTQSPSVILDRQRLGKGFWERSV
jgi:hypothetical protein